MSEPSFAFSFPLCDLLICEFEACSESVTSTNLYDPLHRDTIELPARPFPKSTTAQVRHLALFVYQKIVRRIPIPFQPHPDQPNYLLCYVKETLACGHVAQVHPSELETLTARKRNCHECVSEAGTEIFQKKPNASILRSMERYRRKQNGESVWISVGFAVGYASLLVVAFTARTRDTHFYSYPSNYLRIVQNLDACQADGSCGYRFIVQSVSNGVAGPETEMHFCENGSKPRFEQGHTFSWIRYANIGSCNSIDGFDVVRGGNRQPILAPNCKADYTQAPIAGHILCEGGRANF